MPAPRNTATPPICRSLSQSRHGSKFGKRGSVFTLPLAGRVDRQRRSGWGYKRRPLPPPASTNPISTKCTARNPCPTAPAANPRATTPAQPPAAKSSSPPTRASPARSSDRHRDRAAARRGIGVGGRRGRLFNLRLHFNVNQFIIAFGTGSLTVKRPPSSSSSMRSSLKVADARSIRVRYHMPLFLNESAARRQFKDVLGNANHLIITILVRTVRRRTPAYIHLSCRTPNSLGIQSISTASANRSRVMMLQMSLVRATDALDIYLALARRKPALIQNPTHQQKMDTSGHSVFGKFAVMRDACLSAAPVIASLVEVMIAWRNRQVHSLADNQVSTSSWEALRANANWVKDEFRGMEIDRLFADFSKEAPPSFKEIASFIRATQEAVRIMDAHLLKHLDPQSFLRQLIQEYSLKGNADEDREKLRKRRIQSIWGRDASDRKQRVISFLKNCGLSLSATDENNSTIFSDNIITELSDMTPSEVGNWLGLN